MNLKKKIMVLLAAGIMMLSASPFALAEPDDETDVADVTAEEVVSEGEASSETPVTEAVQTETTPQPQPAQILTNDKYLTKGGAAVWFIIILLANGALSFWIGNRFYRLAKKENHLGAELRALRRDIDDKFVKSVGGFAEQEIEIENLNEFLAVNSEGVKSTLKKQQAVKERTPEEEERFRKWEEAQSRPRTERASRPARSAVREELQEELDDVKTLKRKTYKPRREESGSNEEAENLGETRVIKPVGEGVKNKAKEIINDIFPFKED